jgi:hypothetical protein
MISISSSIILRDYKASFNTTLATRVNFNESIGDHDIIERGSYVGWPWFVKYVYIPLHFYKKKKSLHTSRLPHPKTTPCNIKVKVKVTLRLTVSQSVCLGVVPLLGHMTSNLFILIS